MLKLLKKDGKCCTRKIERETKRCSRKQAINTNVNRCEIFEMNTNEDMTKEEQHCKNNMNKTEEKLDAAKSRIKVRCETKLMRSKKKRNAE